MEANNMKEMRETLEVIRGMVNEEFEDLKDISDEVGADFISIRGWCDHALAKPPRNCDVGTPSEQHERFMKFCVHVHKSVCGDCPLIGGGSLCQLQWAQMPYTESEYNGEQK